MNATANRIPPPPPVTIEYDSRNGRTRKTFLNAAEGRRFYVSKHSEGRNPKVSVECSDGATTVKGSDRG